MNFLEEIERLRLLLKRIETQLQGINGVKVEITEIHPGSYPILKVTLDESKLGRSAFEVSQSLRAGSPPIYVDDRHLDDGLLTIHSVNLKEKLADIVSQRLYTEITS